jgi:hypothetical protein
MIAFTSSPKKKLAPDLDAAKIEEHKNLLNQAMSKHVRAIRLCMKDLGYTAYNLIPKMLVDDVYGTCKFMLNFDDNREEARLVVLRYEAENKIGSATFCTPKFSTRSVEVKKGRKKKK